MGSNHGFENKLSKRNHLDGFLQWMQKIGEGFFHVSDKGSTEHVVKFLSNVQNKKMFETQPLPLMTFKSKPKIHKDLITERDDFTVRENKVHIPDQ